MIQKLLVIYLLALVSTGLTVAFALRGREAPEGAVVGYGLLMVFWLVIWGIVWLG